MILKRQKIGSFKLVHELNGDGVELDMGSLGKEKHLIINCVIPIFSNYFGRRLGNFNWKFLPLPCPVFMVSLFLERANYEELVRECLNAMKVMDAKVAFLPLGGIKAGWEGRAGASGGSCKAAEESWRYGCCRRFSY